MLTSVFHISVVQESKALHQPINIQIKTELSTRKRLAAPSWRDFFVLKTMEVYRLFELASAKLDKRMDLAKFLRDQKKTNLALRGLLSQSQHMFCERQGQILVREGMLHDLSDIDSNDSVDMDDASYKKVHNAPRVAETHSYVDVLAHRLNEVD